MKIQQYINLNNVWKIFLAIAHFLLIAPKETQTVRCFQYALIFLVGLVQSALFTISQIIYFTEISPNCQQKSLTACQISGFLQIAIVFSGVVNLLLDYHTCTKTKQWHLLYSLSKPKKSRVFHTELVWLSIILAVNFLFVMSLIFNIISFRFLPEFSIFLRLAALTSPLSQSFYTLITSSLMILVILGIHQHLRQIILSSKFDKAHITQMKIEFNDVHHLVNLFNELFGHHILIILWQWMIYIVSLYIKVSFMTYLEGVYFFTTFEILVQVGFGIILTSVSSN